MDLGAAATRATELLELTQSARAAVAPMSGTLTDTTKAFASTVPGQLTVARQLAATKEAEMAEAQKQAAEAVESHEAATRARRLQEPTVARW